MSLVGICIFPFLTLINTNHCSLLDWIYCLSCRCRIYEGLKSCMLPLVVQIYAARICAKKPTQWSLLMWAVWHGVIVCIGPKAQFQTGCSVNTNCTCVLWELIWYQYLNTTCCCGLWTLQSVREYRWCQIYTVSVAFKYWSYRQYRSKQELPYSTPACWHCGRYCELANTSDVLTTWWPLSHW